jgi:hypothetical protein
MLRASAGGAGPAPLGALLAARTAGSIGSVPTGGEALGAADSGGGVAGAGAGGDAVGLGALAGRTTAPVAEPVPLPKGSLARADDDEPTWPPARFSARRFTDRRIRMKHEIANHGQKMNGTIVR